METPGHLCLAGRFFLGHFATKKDGTKSTYPLHRIEIPIEILSKKKLFSTKTSNPLTPVCIFTFSSSACAFLIEMNFID